MNIDIQTRQAYSEIDEFLDLLDEEKKNEIPKKLRELFKKEKDNNYYKGINLIIPIREQNLKSETLALIALLNLQYWCKNENEKEELKQIYEDNEKKYQEELKEKYNVDDIFKRKNDNKLEENVVELIVYKESIIKKFFEKIFQILHIKKK